MAPFLVRTGERQRPLGEGLRLLQAAGQQLRLPQRETTERLISDHFRCTELCHRLREQRHGVGDAPAQGIRRAQGRSRHGEKAREVRVLTDAHSPFEAREGPGQVTLAEGQQTEPVIGTHKAPGVRDLLGDPQPFFPEGTALGEQAELGMARGEPGTGGHGWQEHLAEALVALRPIEERQPSAVNRPTIVALGLVGLAEVLVRRAGQYPRQPRRASGRAGPRRWPGHTHPLGCNGLPERARPVPADAGRQGPSASDSASRRHARLRPKSPRRTERRAQGKPEVDGLLARVARLRQMRENTERLLEIPHGLAVGRPRHGLLPGLPAVGQGLGPHLTPQGMVRQPFDLFCQASRSGASSASTMRACSTRRRSCKRLP